MLSYDAAQTACATARVRLVVHARGVHDAAVAGRVSMYVRIYVCRYIYVCILCTVYVHIRGCIHVYMYAYMRVFDACLDRARGIFSNAIGLFY